MGDLPESPVLVRVVEVGGGRTIGWSDQRTERLLDRLSDVQEAISTAAVSIGAGLKADTAAAGWQVAEVSATFAVTLTAEAGVLIGRAGGEALFEVQVTYQRRTE